MGRSSDLRLGISRKLTTEGKRQEYIKRMQIPSTPGGAPELSSLCIHMPNATKFTHFTSIRTPSSITIHHGEFQGELLNTGALSPPIALQPQAIVFI